MQQVLEELGRHFQTRPQLLPSSYQQDGLSARSGAEGQRKLLLPRRRVLKGVLWRLSTAWASHCSRSVSKRTPSHRRRRRRRRGYRSDADEVLTKDAKQQEEAEEEIQETTDSRREKPHASYRSKVQARRSSTNSAYPRQVHHGLWRKATNLLVDCHCTIRVTKRRTAEVRCFGLYRTSGDFE